MSYKECFECYESEENCECEGCDCPTCDDNYEECDCPEDGCECENVLDIDMDGVWED
jgi:hypothetical protein